MGLSNACASGGYKGKRSNIQEHTPANRHRKEKNAWNGELVGKARVEKTQKNGIGTNHKGGSFQKKKCGKKRTGKHATGSKQKKSLRRKPGKMGGAGTVISFLKKERGGGETGERGENQNILKCKGKGEKKGGMA